MKYEELAAMFPDYVNMITEQNEEEYKGFFDGMTSSKDIDRAFVKEVAWITQCSALSPSEMAESISALTALYNKIKKNIETKLLEDGEEDEQ